MAKVLVFRCLSNCNVNYLVEQEEKDISCPPHESWKIPELETCSATQYQYHHQGRNFNHKKPSHVIPRQTPLYYGSQCPLLWEIHLKTTVMKSQTKLLEKPWMDNFCQWSTKCGLGAVHKVEDFQLLNVSGI